MVSAAERRVRHVGASARLYAVLAPGPEEDSACARILSVEMPASMWCASPMTDCGSGDRLHVVGEEGHARADGAVLE